MADTVVDLQNLADLDQAVALSADRPVFIYKHSTACPICARTYRLIHEVAEKGNLDHAPFFAEVFVIEKREVSDAIEERFGVSHQSPQLLLLRNASSVWDSSHFEITEAAISQVLEDQKV
ncbi:MAG: bacillithiol system redox-active protein YtxJ [Candidatus Latescibacteria bacterium]|jgi:bacillithiol system protein YtxJ|nr:bacillithiol system redox-active protein YtxJ [Candidatus Latescibacterota bacterium]